FPSHEKSRALLLFHRNRRYFNPRTVDQGGCLNGCACRFWIGHDAAVLRIHVAKFFYICQEYSDRHNVFHLKARGFDDSFDILQRRLGFASDSARHEFAFVICALLARNVKRISRNHTLAERQATSVGRIDRTISLRPTSRRGEKDHRKRSSNRKRRYDKSFHPQFHSFLFSLLK